MRVFSLNPCLHGDMLAWLHGITKAIFHVANWEKPLRIQGYVKQHAYMVPWWHVILVGSGGSECTAGQGGEPAQHSGGARGLRTRPSVRTLRGAGQRQYEDLRAVL